MGEVRLFQVSRLLLKTAPEGAVKKRCDGFGKEAAGFKAALKGGYGRGGDRNDNVRQRVARFEPEKGHNSPHPFS